MIDIRRFPKKFMQDSIDRGVFDPESDSEASVEQIKALLSDAEFYADQWGPEAPWLKSSAKATVRHCRRALGLEGQE